MAVAAGARHFRRRNRSSSGGQQQTRPESSAADPTVTVPPDEMEALAPIRETSDSSSSDSDEIDDSSYESDGAKLARAALRDLAPSGTSASSSASTTDDSSSSLGFGTPCPADRRPSDPKTRFSAPTLVPSMSEADFLRHKARNSVGSRWHKAADVALFAARLRGTKVEPPFHRSTMGPAPTGGPPPIKPRTPPKLRPSINRYQLEVVEVVAPPPEPVSVIDGTKGN